MAERKNILDAILRDLDDQCSIILVEITMNPKGIGFNSLYKKIRKHPGFLKIAKPTLVDHLQHLFGFDLIEKEILENSKLKLKPTLYKTSQYFRKLSKGMIAQSTTPEDLLPIFREKDAQTATNLILNQILLETVECLKITLQTPDKISTWNMRQHFYILETLMKAYRERILEKNELAKALETLQASIQK